MSEIVWKKIGSVTTEKKVAGQKIKSQDVFVKQSYVVIGFEVEHLEIAFKDNIHDLDARAPDGSDLWGHAFYYVVKEGKISTLLSFDPIAAGAKGKSHLARQGSPDYRIPDATKLFRINLTVTQLIALERETAKMRKAITNGDQPYIAIINDTCAETAKQVLDAAGISTPSAKAKVRKTITTPTPEWEGFKLPPVTFPAKPHEISIEADDPYGWYKNFKDARYKEVSYLKGLGANEGKVKELIGQLDPLEDKW